MEKIYTGQLKSHRENIWGILLSKMSENPLLPNRYYATITIISILVIEMNLL